MSLENPFIAPPLDVHTATYEATQWAEPFSKFLRLSGRPCRVVSPCAGVNSPERAAREMQMPWVSVGDYEKYIGLKPALLYLTQDENSVHVGRARGDVLGVPLCDLPLDADGLVSGPPCPPFSTIGARLLDLDARSDVFLAIAKWILHLVFFGKLSWFVLENVPGIKKKKRGDEESFASWFMREMTKELPDTWSMRLVDHNSNLCLLPQNRPRVFFVGTSPALRATPLQRRVLAANPLSRPPVDIMQFLDKTSQPADYDRLSFRQKINLTQQLDDFRQAESTTVGIVDVARDPLRAFDSEPSVGCTRTLRTNCCSLWILPGKSFEAVFGEKGRFLNRSEKCRLAGIVPSSLAMLSDSDLDQAIGNTIPVPLIGHVLYPVLRAWAESLKRS